ncbi:MAG: hypothetical protein ACR2P0_17455, partial [Acidimicrobiales bacterium]
DVLDLVSEPLSLEDRFLRNYDHDRDGLHSTDDPDSKEYIDDLDPRAATDPRDAGDTEVDVVRLS